MLFERAQCPALSGLHTTNVLSIAALSCLVNEQCLGFEYKHRLVLNKRYILIPNGNNV